MKREELIKYLNDEMIRRESKIRFQKSSGLYSIEFSLDDGFIDSCILNCTDEFYTIVEKLIKEKMNISKIQWNNTGSTFSLWIDENNSFLTD